MSNFWWEWIGLELELVAIDGGGRGEEKKKERAIYILCTTFPSPL